MAGTIWKYKVPIADRFTLDIPKDYAFLDVQTQGFDPSLWALVDPDRPKETARFALVATGGAYPDADEGSFWYIGTFQLLNGALVYHLFYRDPLGD